MTQAVVHIIFLYIKRGLCNAVTLDHLIYSWILNM